MTTIKKATEKDLEMICMLDSTVLGNSSRRVFLANAVKADQCLVAQAQNTVVGFAILEQSFYGQGFISLLIVHPDYRKHGIATALIQHIESICPTKKLFTSTNKSNVIAQQVFEALGFVRSGYVENLDKGNSEIIYFKQLMDKDV